MRTRAQITKFYGMKCQMQVRASKLVICPCASARVREREIVVEDHRHERGVVLTEVWSSSASESLSALAQNPFLSPRSTLSPTPLLSPSLPLFLSPSFPLSLSPSPSFPLYLPTCIPLSPTPCAGKTELCSERGGDL